MRTIHLLIEGEVKRRWYLETVNSIRRGQFLVAILIPLFSRRGARFVHRHRCKRFEKRSMKTVNKLVKKGGRNHRNVEINSRGISGEDHTGVKIN